MGSQNVIPFSNKNVQIFRFHNKHQLIILSNHRHHHFKRHSSQPPMRMPKLGATQLRRCIINGTRARSLPSQPERRSMEPTTNNQWAPITGRSVCGACACACGRVQRIPPARSTQFARIRRLICVSARVYRESRSPTLTYASAKQYFRHAE